MSGGTEFSEAPKISEVKEVQAESQDLARVEENLNRSTFNASAEIQARAELTILASENLEKEVKAAVDAVPGAAEVKPAEINLSPDSVKVEGVGEGGITIEAAEAAVEAEMDPDPVDAAGGEAETPPPPGDASVSVSPSNDAVQGIHAVGRTGGGDFDFSAEMQGAPAGELSGFENQDGETSYAFTGDGETSVSSVSGQIFGRESSEVPPDPTAELVEDTPVEYAPPGSSADSGVEGPSGSAHPVREQEPGIAAAVESATEQGGEMPPETSKAVGYTPSSGAMGLPLDDDDGTDDGDGAGDAPPPPPPPDTGTGVSSNLPGTGLAGGESFTPEGAAQSTSQVEFSQPAAAGMPEDANVLAQSVLRDAYMDSNRDLAFYAEKVKFFNECKEEIRNYLTDLRDQGDELPAEADPIIQDQPTEATGVNTETSRPAVTQEQVLSLTEFLEEDPLAAAREIFGKSIVQTNEDKRYFLSKLTDMNKIVEAMSDVMSDVHEKAQLEEQIADLNETIGSYYEAIARYEGYADVLNQEITMLENLLENMNEGDTVTITHHQYSQPWGVVSWDIVTVEMTSTMIEELIQDKYQDITNINGKINNLQSNLDDYQEQLAVLLLQYNQLGYDISDLPSPDDNASDFPDIQNTQDTSPQPSINDIE